MADWKELRNAERTYSGYKLLIGLEYDQIGLLKVKLNVNALLKRYGCLVLEH